MSDNKFINVTSYYMVPDGKGHWVSYGAMNYFSKKYGSITVPAGAINDLASIPWVLRRVFAVNGPHRPAAALHDYLYHTGGLAGRFTREECDNIFLEAMLCTKKGFYNAYPGFVRNYLVNANLSHCFDSNMPITDIWVAKLMYRGVRLGGKWSFMTHN